jgi:hypothetical protein
MPDARIAVSLPLFLRDIRQKVFPRNSFTPSQHPRNLDVAYHPNGYNMLISQALRMPCRMLNASYKLCITATHVTDKETKAQKS